MEEQMKNPDLTEGEPVPQKERGRYSTWIRLTALVLVIAIILNFLTGVDFSLLRYEGTDQMVAAQYLMDSTTYLGENRLQRLKSLLTGVDPFGLNLQAAEIAIGKTDYERAAKFLNKAIPLSPDDLQKAELYNRLGCVYMLAEEPTQARQAFDSSVALDPKAPTPYLLRAQLRYQDGDEAGAVQDAVDYLKLGGNDGEMLLTAASLCELGGDIESAVDAMDRKLQTAQTDGDKADAYAERGRLFYLMGREENAAADISQAKKLNLESLSGVHYAIVALCEYNSGEHAESRDDFLAAARLSEDGNAEYYEQAVLCSYHLSDYASIEKIIEEAKRKDKMTASSFLIEGILRFSEERYEEAKVALTSSLDTGTTVTGAYYYRGLSRMALGEYETAVEDYTAAIHWEEDKYGCIFNRGVCYYALGEIKSAAEDFQSVVDHSSDESLVLSAMELLTAMKIPTEE